MTEDGKMELLACPFCGGAATMECIGEDGSARWSAGCSADVESCMAYQSLTSFARRSDAVKAWNTRATPTDTSAGERMKEALGIAADWMQRYLDTFGELGDDATQANIDDWQALAALDLQGPGKMDSEDHSTHEA